MAIIYLSKSLFFLPMLRRQTKSFTSAQIAIKIQFRAVVMSNVTGYTISRMCCKKGVVFSAFSYCGMDR